MKEIPDIRLSRMSGGMHFTFMSNILARAEADTAVMARAEALVKSLRAAVDEEDASLGLTRKSLLTDDIAKADIERDTLYAGYKKALGGFVRMKGTDMAKAAETLRQHIRDFGINTRYQLDRETGLLTNFIGDLQGRYAPQVASLGLTAFVTGMHEANERLRALTLRRTEERMGVKKGALKAARAASDTAYRSLVRMVNALAVVFGDADYAPFMDYCNVEIVHCRREASGRKAGAEQTAPPPAAEAAEAEPAGEAGEAQKL